MATINQLSATDSLNGGDLLPVYKQNQGDARKCSVTTLMDYVNANVTTITQNTQYAAPSATGFIVTVNSGNVWLILTPVSTYATGEIILSGASDKDTVTVNSTQEVTSLTVSSVASVAGAPTTLTANGFFTMRFDAATNTWYRIA